MTSVRPPVGAVVRERFRISLPLWDRVLFSYTKYYSSPSADLIHPFLPEHKGLAARKETLSRVDEALSHMKPEFQGEVDKFISNYEWR